MSEILHVLANLTSSSSSDDEEYLFGEIHDVKNYQQRVNEEYYTDREFKKKFKMSKESINRLVSLIETNQEGRNDNRGLPVSTKQKLMIVLRFFATGSFQLVCGDLIGVSQSTVCRVIKEMCVKIARLSREIIKLPETEEERTKIVQGFHQIGGISRCIGAIDGCQIPIRSPGGENAEIFRNRKGWFAINVQAVCDSNDKFTDIVARWHGSAHDQTVFNFSSIKQRFESGEFGNLFLIGDGGYGCKEYLITPYRNPSGPQQQRYNIALKSTRNCIERLFGQWKRRFSVLNAEIRLNLQTTLPVIVATAVLHNLLKDWEDLYEFDDAEEQEFLSRAVNDPISTIYPNSSEFSLNPRTREQICQNF